MTIGQVAKESGLPASTIRFYEKAGVLPRPSRIGGRRQYASSVLERLAVVDRAKACGFSLTEIRQLFYGFRDNAPPSERWQTLAQRKIIELDDMARKIAAMKEVLERSCTCKDFTVRPANSWEKAIGRARPKLTDRTLPALQQILFAQLRLRTTV